MTTKPEMTAAEIASAVATRKMSALDATEAALSRIKQHDGILNSFTDITADRARTKARAVDADIAAGKDVGPLAGVPFAVKNLFDVAGLPTRAGSKINRDRAPAKRDATLIERMEAAGAVLVGALNMGEYAYDFTGENVHDGPSRNPHNTTRMSGGSSGGSGSAVGGAAVAARVVAGDTVETAVAAVASAKAVDGCGRAGVAGLAATASTSSAGCACARGAGEVRVMREKRERERERERERMNE